MVKGNNNTTVSVVLGSDSDLPIAQACIDLLKELGISYELRILSAHRTPEELAEYARNTNKRGVKVIIAMAGLSAALPGAIAAHTHLPVIGVPINSGPLAGIDALLAISQMPAGIPIATMSIGKTGAKNAAIYAARILALNNKNVASKLRQLTRKQHAKVLTKDRELSNQQ